jgi:hypothetical protein
VAGQADITMASRGASPDGRSSHFLEAEYRIFPGPGVTRGEVLGEHEVPILVGVTAATLAKWREQFLAGGPSGPPRSIDRLVVLYLHHKSMTTSSCGCEQQISTLPAAGGSSGSG